MLFIAVLCILLGMTGLGICGLVLVMRISEALSDADNYGW